MQYLCIDWPIQLKVPVWNLKRWFYLFFYYFFCCLFSFLFTYSSYLFVGCFLLLFKCTFAPDTVIRLMTFRCNGDRLQLARTLSMYTNFSISVISLLLLVSLFFFCRKSETERINTHLQAYFSSFTLYFRVSFAVNVLGFWICLSYFTLGDQRILSNLTMLNISAEKQNTFRQYNVTNSHISMDSLAFFFFFFFFSVLRYIFHWLSEKF